MSGSSKILPPYDDSGICLDCNGRGSSPTPSKVSDEEIESEAKKRTTTNTDYRYAMNSKWFKRGAKWMRDQPPTTSKSAEKKCKYCQYHEKDSLHDKMWCRDCTQKNHFKLLT